MESTRTIMKKSMNKPLISILLALYNPNIQWLEQQLYSLDNQSYDNIELVIIDDCSEDISYKVICECIERCINQLQYQLFRNEKNLGSSKTFERLTQFAKGKYIAYCDQDDIWERDKLLILKQFIEEEEALVVCGDVTVIDNDGNIIADSITKVRKRHVFKEGYNLEQGLLYKNFVIGCTMLINAQVAKSAIPFIDSMVHDHYLALYSAVYGKIAVYHKPLVFYRIHESNQTSVMAGVRTKKDYYEKRIIPFYNRIREISSRMRINGTDEALCWAQARINYYNGDWRSGKVIWKHRNLNKTTAIFELVSARMPEFLFSRIIKLIQEGRL